MNRIFIAALVLGYLCAPAFAQNIVTMPNVFGGYNIYVPGRPVITTTPNVFGGQNIYTQRGMVTTTPNVFGGDNIYAPQGLDLGEDD